MLLCRWETLLLFLDLDKSNVPLLTSEVKWFLTYLTIMQILPSSLIFNDGLRARNTFFNYRETRDQALLFTWCAWKAFPISTTVVRGTDVLLGALLLCFPLKIHVRNVPSLLPSYRLGVSSLARGRLASKIHAKFNIKILFVFNWKQFTVRPYCY